LIELDGNGGFIDMMNKKAKEIGMKQTYFLNESGLDASENFAGSYGSAKDMALLFAYVLRSNHLLLEATSYEALDISSFEENHSASNTNKSIDNISGVIASKTGFTDLAGGNLVVVFDVGPLRPIIVSVLGSTAEGRFFDVEKLANISIRAIVGME